MHAARAPRWRAHLCVRAGAQERAVGPQGLQEGAKIKAFYKLVDFGLPGCAVKKMPFVGVVAKAWRTTTASTSLTCRAASST